MGSTGVGALRSFLLQGITLNTKKRGENRGTGSHSERGKHLGIYETKTVDELGDIVLAFRFVMYVWSEGYPSAYE